MSDQHQGYSIGEIADRAGIEASAIRYYESLGLLPKPSRVGGRRRYTVDVLDRLSLIGLAKDSGFSMKEIRELVRGLTPTTNPAAAWRKLATNKLLELDAAAARIRRMRKVLRVALDCGCVDLEECAPILRANS